MSLSVLRFLKCRSSQDVFKQQKQGINQLEDEAKTETEEQVKEIKGIADQKGDEVVDDLISAVVDVKTEPLGNVTTAE